MNVGDRVKVLQCNEDDNCNKDFEGLIGEIVKKDYAHGCGQVDNDPLIHVKFPDGTIEAFWTEEVVLA